MKKVFYWMAVAAASLLAIGGCKEKIDREVVAPVHVDKIAFTVSGEKVFIYDAQTWQEGVNADNRTFFLSSDDGQEWLKMTCGEMPTAAGQRISANLEWKNAGADKPTSRSSEMEVVSIGENTGIIFLWDSKNSIGVSLPNERL